MGAAAGPRGPAAGRVGGAAGWRCQGGGGRVAPGRKGRVWEEQPRRGRSDPGSREGPLYYRLRPEAPGIYRVSSGSAPLCGAGGRTKRRVREPRGPRVGMQKARGRGEKGHARWRRKIRAGKEDKVAKAWRASAESWRPDVCGPAAPR